jgi:predicted dienelactone hydrolase
VLDQLELWNRQDGHPLRGKLDPARIGTSGHSFGAITTQAVTGQTVARGLVSLTDPRIKAAIVFSPSTPVQIRDPKDAFGNVKIPWMLMTGTQDVAAIRHTTVAQRLAVFPALPPGGKYELVLFEAEHSVFTDRPLPGESGKRNPNHHRAILALSTAFWDAWLRADPEAKAWLDGAGPATILEKQDRWQRK